MTTQKIEANQNNTELLIKKIQKQFPDEKLEIKEISKGLFSVEGNNRNIFTYINEKGELLGDVNVGRIVDFKEYPDILKRLGYKEEKNGKTFIMKRIKDGSVVDKYSVEYYEIWSKSSFTIDINFKEKPESKRLSQKQFDKLFASFVVGGAFRIKDLQGYLKREQIDFEYFKSKLPELEKILPSQCLDMRFENVYNFEGKPFSDIVTEKEIKGYYERGLISKDTAVQCFKNIQERDKLIEEYKKEKTKIQKDSKNEIDNYFA